MADQQEELINFLNKQTQKHWELNHQGNPFLEDFNSIDMEGLDSNEVDQTLRLDEESLQLDDSTRTELIAQKDPQMRNLTGAYRRMWHVKFISSHLDGKVPPNVPKWEFMMPYATNGEKFKEFIVASYAKVKANSEGLDLIEVKKAVIEALKKEINGVKDIAKISTELSEKYGALILSKIAQKRK